VAIGLKSQFSAAFRQTNFSLVQESKLRQREQGNEEDVVAYFYDIINLCRIVNPTMSQEQQLQYLYRGFETNFFTENLSLSAGIDDGFFGVKQITRWGQ
jgi:hypothetical protein